MEPFIRWTLPLWALSNQPFITYIRNKGLPKFDFFRLKVVKLPGRLF
jgi:hypothetical protein